MIEFRKIPTNYSSAGDNRLMLYQPVGGSNPFTSPNKALKQIVLGLFLF
jgi:hypothetical protein